MTNGVVINGDAINGGAVGESPLFISIVAPIDGIHVKVIFSEAVVQSEALNPVNYSIPGLSVQGVMYETDFTYVVTTSAQDVGVEYFLTASNIHDLNGNRI